MDPQQEIFTKLLLELKENEEITCKVYDTFLPPDGTLYPFVYLGDSQLNDEILKNAIFGRVTQTVHVWHSNSRERGRVSELLLKIKQIARSIHATNNFFWNIRSVDQRIIPDNTTNTPLIHGVLEITFQFD